MITAEQHDTAILATFNSMEDGTFYVLKEAAFAAANAVRLRKGYGALRYPRSYYTLMRRGAALIANGGPPYDFTNKSNFYIDLPLSLDGSAISGLPLSLAFTAALLHGDIEKLDTGLDGKIATIDGKPYRLTAV